MNTESRCVTLRGSIRCPYALGILAVLLVCRAGLAQAQTLIAEPMPAGTVANGTLGWGNPGDRPALFRSGFMFTAQSDGTSDARARRAKLFDPVAASPADQRVRSAGSLSDWWPASSRSFQRVQPNGAPQTTGEQDPAPTPENPHHIFIVVPAFKVEYGKNAPPLTPREKLTEFLESTYDPLGLGFAGVEALLLEHSNQDGFCGYGPGIGGYAKCYGAARLDAIASGFFGDFLFPVWMHQDPRYFRLGERSGGVRVLHALTRVFITRSDTTRAPVFNSSALAGTVLAGTLSNLYYPHADRGVGLTLSRMAIDLAATATFNLAAEFWQDIKTKVFRWKD